MANNKLKALKRHQNKKQQQEQQQQQQDLNDRIKIWAKLRNNLYEMDQSAASKLLFPFQDLATADPKLIPIYQK